MIRDENIFKDVMWKLNSDPRIDAKNIIVGVKDKIVTLTGKVNHYYEKGYVEDDVKSVKGVVGVAEELDVDLFDQHIPSDTEIAKAIIKSLGWDLMFNEQPTNFQVVVENGMVKVTGHVTYQFQKDRVFANIRHMNGVKGVINNIKVKPKIKPDNIKEKIIEGFVKSARLDGENITIEVDGDSVTLQGRVKSWFEHEEAKRIVNLIPGIRKVNNFIHL